MYVCMDGWMDGWTDVCMYGMAWFGMVWVWYRMVWYCIVFCCIVLYVYVYMYACVYTHNAEDVFRVKYVSYIEYIGMYIHKS